MSSADLITGTVVVELPGEAGELCGRILADLGAEVIKVEPLAGDPSRQLAPLADDTSIHFAFHNSGKRSVAVDLTQDSGRELLHDLLGRADVLVVADPASLAATGLSREGLAERFPRLVIVNITGFGKTGPYSDYLCPDIVGMAMGGLMGVSGASHLAPVTAPGSQAYHFASVFAVQGALLSLVRRDGDYGRGACVDVSIHQALASIEQLIRIYGHQGRVVRRTGSQHKHVVPAALFATKDGFVSLFVNDHHWHTFLDAWPDHPAELDDPTLIRTHHRMAKIDLINGAVRDLVSTYTTADFVARMAEVGVPCTPVNNLSEFLADEQSQMRGVQHPVTHPGLGPAIQVGFPAIIDGVRPTARPAPVVGDATRAVLKSHLGLGDSRIDELTREGVVAS